MDRQATPEELAQMKELVRQGMRDGAFGLSTGLFYVPGTFTPTDEVIELAKVAGEMGGIHISHMREEASKVLDSVRETIAIGEKGGLPTQVTHHKIIGRPNWGRSVETLRLIDEARARGVDATIDQYPYTASSTGLQAPAAGVGARGRRREDAAAPGGSGDARAHQGKGRREHQVRPRRRRPEERPDRALRLRSCARGQEPGGDHAGGRAAGRASRRRPTRRLELVEKGGCSGIFHAINEEDLGRILAHPATMIASDGEVTSFGKDSPHPRSYGTFARVLGRYVRERKLLTLEEAVRKMSAMPAARIGLVDRGLLRPGMKADLAVFDPERVADKATFEQPHQYAVGVELVVVNGQVVFENGAMTAARPGRILLGPAASR